MAGGTYYYIRAYATNSTGTAYGNEIIIITPLTDIEGNIYYTVRIGDQVWIRENLKTTKYNDNTDIPVVTDNVTWINLTTPAVAWYNNSESYLDHKYGVLYNWFTVNSSKLCSTGWHVPNEDEWTTLVEYLGGEYNAGGSLKEQGTGHWTNPNLGASDIYGFTALPAGFRTGLNPGTFRAMGYISRWWVSTESDDPRWARCRTIFFDAAEVVMGMGLKTNGDKSGKRDSNPRPLAWEANALPLSYSRNFYGFFNFRYEPPMGFEPTTCSLRVSCSTAELRRQKKMQI